MSDVRKAERFLEHYGSDYLKLLRWVKEACEEVKRQLGPSVVDNVYTRKESVGGDDELSGEFKEPAKIAAKARQRNKQFMELTDIIGLTAVVQYPDEVDNFIAKVRQLIKKNKVRVKEIERHVAKNGYYATHVVFYRQFGVERLYCEMQVKTILHDAWSAKMHDLTYKPMGMLDTRLSALMGSIAATIDSLEYQSRLIRDMIKAGWNVEESARQIARHSTFNELLKYWDADQKPAWFVDLQQKIETAADSLETETYLLAAVKDACEKGDTLRYAWMLAGRIASLRPSPEFTRFFMRHADAWLELAPSLLAKQEIHEKEISAVPLMFYIIGDLERAIDCANEILTGQTFVGLSGERRAKLEFNLVTFMIEREYHLPTQSGEARDQMKLDIERRLSGPAVQGIKPKMESEFRDTQGLLKIAFATTKEEARLGIEDCVAARLMPAAVPGALVDAYADLNMRLGWRRYFELEVRGK